MNRVIALICLLVLLPLACKREAPAPTTAPTSAPAPATKPAPTTSYVEVIRAAYPKLAATQPLGVPVDLPDAGHFVLNQPVFLDARGDLWITHPNAPPLLEVLKSAEKEQVHIVPKPIVFVQWAVDENSKWFPRVVTRDSAGNLTWIDRDNSRPATPGRVFRWNDVLYYADDKLVVPTDRGVSIINFTPEFSEAYHEIVTEAGTNPPRVVVDPGGLIAFSPWTGDKPGGRGAWRYADGKWSPLTADQQWPEKLVHAVPLLDGSVLQLFRESPTGPVKLALGPLATAPIDENAITLLVDQLSDDDPDKRAQAYIELTRYGPPSWPLLDRLRNDQPPEARVRLEHLLSNRIEPTLGGQKPVDGVMHLADRFADGGVLFFLPAGVTTPPPDELHAPTLTKPAWVSFRPGRAIELLEPVLVKDADPKSHHLFAFGDEWIISDPKTGPQRLLGNHLEAMTSNDESAYAYVVGSDRRGRWLFKKSPDDAQTLILDPTLPDTTPRLPVWLLSVPQGLVGWNKENFPAMKSGDAWALTERGWKGIDRKTDAFLTGLTDQELKEAMRMIEARQQRQQQQQQPAARPIARQVAPKFAPRLPATQPTDEPILIDAEGRKYFDGHQTLRVLDTSGAETVWPLPPNSTGAGPVVLLRIDDGTLFLFNAPGRVIRIKPTPEAPDSSTEPFRVEAVFTDKIPKPDQLQRIWLDPAGRIVIAYDLHNLAILFPQGRIPREIAVLITETKAP